MPKAFVGLAAPTASENNEEELLARFPGQLPYALGRMNHICIHCRALRWGEERTKMNIKDDEELYLNCCQYGDVKLPMADFDGPPLPDDLLELFTSSSKEAEDFQMNITSYNNALSFSSLGCKQDRSVMGQKGVRTFKVSGQLSHKIPALYPDGDKAAKFAQIFMLGDGGEREVDNRLVHFKKGKLKRHITRKLQDIMHRVNPYAEVFWNAAEILENEGNMTIVLKSLAPGNRETKTYNKPRPEDIAAIVEEGNFIDAKPRHIKVSRKDGKMIYLTDLHTPYLSLRYPLLLPYGSQQWDDNYVSPTKGTNQGRKRADYKVTNLEWGAWLIFERDGKFNPFIHGRSLTQQLIVDLYLCVERSKLDYIRFNQKKIKAELYQGIKEAFNKSQTAPGKQIILPSSFKGGPRDMNQLFHDAMALVRDLGNPSLFITMTANPNWKEIQNELRYGESASDRPDLVARVFHLKLQKLIEEIVDHQRLGVVISNLMVVEFQKRGLPHSHLLFIVDEKSKPVTADDVDRLVSATLPDPVHEAKLYELVTSHMLHGPCRKGMSCFQEGRCRLSFPKPSCEESCLSDNAFPSYKRPNDGRKVKKGGAVFTNGHVVPYNKYLLLLLECHINVEIPVGTKPIRYLYKYLTKGHDRTKVYMELTTTNGKKVSVHDELLEFQNYRYISAPEAAYRLMKLPMNSSFPPVMRLPLHLENQQTVYFVDEMEAVSRIELRPPPTSTLTEFFRLCAEGEVGLDNVPARSLLYAEVPRYFRWHQGKFRKRIHPKPSVRRVYYANLTDGDKYYLRMLLCYVRGPKSFKHLRTVNGYECSTFREAADKLGLLASDKHHEAAMTEASHWSSAKQLRHLLALILVYGEVASPDALWNQFEGELTEDCEARLTKLGARVPVKEELKRAYGLQLLSQLIEDMGKSSTTVGLSKELIECMEQIPLGALLENRTSIVSAEDSRIIYNQQVETLNDEQKAILDYVQRGHVDGTQTISFLDGPGGTGKTYTLNTLLHYFNGHAGCPVSVSSSGVSAILLLGGTTAHYGFNIPIPPDSDATCDLNGRCKKSLKIIAAPLIVWDEITMQNRYDVEAVDRALRHICKIDKPFGGKSIVFLGDFRQILPVIRHGSLNDQKRACLKSSSLWSYVRQFRLKVNLRLQSLSGNEEVERKQFASWLLELGKGKLQDRNKAMVSIERVQVETVPTFTPVPGKLIDWVYDDIFQFTGRNDWNKICNYYHHRALITPLNKTVNKINNAMLNKLPGDPFVSVSRDEPDATFHEPTSIDIINSIDFVGFPEHRLKLKIGQPVMLMRNLSLGSGLCNGTRMIIMSVSVQVLRVMIITGPKKGDIIAMPQMKMIHRGTVEQPVPFSRIQFPITAAFCMTVNKAQGQTLGKVGVYMSSPVFAHGQLYVALSRCSNLKNMRMVLATSNVAAETVNIVCRELVDAT